jgi:peptide chain release factor
MNQQKIYLQISAGRGPAECAWVVAQLLKFLMNTFKEEGLNCEVISRNKGQEPSTLNSCLIAISGERAKEKAKQWKEHLTLERGNPIKVFRGLKFQ